MYLMICCTKQDLPCSRYCCVRGTKNVANTSTSSRAVRSFTRGCDNTQTTTPPMTEHVLEKGPRIGIYEHSKSHGIDGKYSRIGSSTHLHSRNTCAHCHAPTRRARALSHPHPRSKPPLSAATMPSSFPHTVKSFETITNILQRR